MMERSKTIANAAVEEFICPVTQDLPIDPVIAEDGWMYERNAIGKHIQLNQANLRSPITNLPMGPRLTSALQVKNATEKLVRGGQIIGEKVERLMKHIEENDLLVALEQKAEQGDTCAMCHLGRIYSEGGNLEKSYYWYKKAAHHEDVIGIFHTGRCLLHGRGVAKNSHYGIYFLSRAMERGSEKATYLIGKWLCLGEKGFPKDPTQGKTLLRKFVGGGCEVKHFGISEGTYAREKAAGQLDE